MVSILESYGKSKLETELDILEARHIVMLNDITEENCLDKINQLNLIDFEKYEIVSCRKEHTIGYFMKWHLDDAQFLKHNLNFKDQHNKQEIIHGKHCVYYPSRKPVYTAIVYFSNHGDDFNGGEFVFADGTKIKPSYGMCIIFDSREVHCVSRILKGNRICILHKFYDK